MDHTQRLILVIDDEEDFSYFTKRNLERNNYSVVSVRDGAAGLSSAKELKPDLILLDIMMPGINGFEVLERLKQDSATASIPVIMLTGLDDEQARLKAGTLQDADYLVKPVEVEQLRSRIEKVLGRPV